MRTRKLILGLLTLAILSACGGGSGGTSAPPANSAPNASFTVTKTNGYAPLTVEFDKVIEQRFEEAVISESVTFARVIQEAAVALDTNF